MYREVMDVIGRCFATRPRRWIVGVTIVVGVVTPVAICAVLPPADRTFAVLASPTQLLMSVTVPFIGALLANDLLRSPCSARLTATVIAAVSAAAAVGALGAAVSAVTVVAFPATDPWEHVAIAAVGGVLIQVTAQLVGVGLGLLIRRPVIACQATIVFPMSMFGLLSSIAALAPAAAWLTPYGAAENLLAGEPIALAQWCVVAVLWGAGLNAVGAMGLRRPREIGG